MKGSICKRTCSMPSVRCGHRYEDSMSRSVGDRPYFSAAMSAKNLEKPSSSVIRRRSSCW